MFAFIQSVWVKFAWFLAELPRIHRISLARSLQAFRIALLLKQQRKEQHLKTKSSLVPLPFASQFSLSPYARVPALQSRHPHPLWAEMIGYKVNVMEGYEGEKGKRHLL